MHIARTGTPQRSICSGAAQVSRLCSIWTPSPERKQNGGVRVFAGERGSGEARRSEARQGRGGERRGWGEGERSEQARDGKDQWSNSQCTYRPVKSLYRNFVHELARLRLPLWLAKILVNLHTHTHTHAARSNRVLFIALYTAQSYVSRGALPVCNRCLLALCSSSHLHK